MHTPDPSLADAAPAAPRSTLDDLGVTPEQLARHERELAAREAAAADPLPGPLAAAFSPDTSPIAGVRLRPVVARDLALLKQLGSPLLAELDQLRKPAADRSPVTWTEQAAWDVIYLFSRPAREAAACLERGAPAFHRWAANEFGDTLSLGAQQALLVRALQNLIASFATSVSYDAKASGDTEVFTPPPPRPQTASAGGSTTSPV